MSPSSRPWRRARPAGSPHRRGLAALLTATVAGTLMAACGAPAKTSTAGWASPSSRPASSAAPSAPRTATPAPPTTTPSETDAGPHAPAGFVAVTDVDPTIVQDIRYATAHNFVGRPIDGYREPLCLLTQQAAEALHRVQTAARAHGYSLKVYDCYRPQRAVDDFENWSKNLDDQKMKDEFYPGLSKSELFHQGYIAGPTTHSSGSTMDLTLVPLPTPAQRAYVPGEQLQPCTAPAGQRFPDNSINMGTGFDCFDSLAHTLDPRVTGPAMDNRLLLKQLMQSAGFKNYSEEWWHYSLTSEPFPHQYFDFPVARSSIS